MDQVRIEQIYTELATINVVLAKDPRERGPGYITSTIAQCHEAMGKVDDFSVEVAKAFTKVTEKVRLLELEMKVKSRAKMLSPRIAELEGVGMEEKKARVAQMLEDDHRQEAMAAYAQSGEQPPAQIPTMEEELLALQNEENALRILRDVIAEKKAHIKQADSGVRLQEKTLESAMRFFGGGNGHQENHGERPGRRKATGELVQDTSWENLSGSTNNPDTGTGAEEGAG